MNMPEKTRPAAYEKHCVCAQKMLYIINENKNDGEITRSNW